MTEQKYNIGNGHEMSVEYDEHNNTKITRELLEDLIKGRCMWEEVLQELEEEREEILHSNDYESEIVNYCLYNFDKAIDIIKQKLSEIEKER